MSVTQQKISEWTEEYPLLADMLDLKPVIWLNPKRREMDQVQGLPVTIDDLGEAEQLWLRFIPYLMKVFPETQGIIESELREAGHMQSQLETYYGEQLPGKLYVKCDNELPVAGSVKARGGFFEVLRYAETLALREGLVTREDSYEWFATQQAKTFFESYSIGVGSTGNLGLSIGIISAELGFKVSVYMSADAKAWKKVLLRKKGVRVVEFSGDFSEAVTAGREETLHLPNGYFVDDEKSRELFLGYSVAAIRLKHQLEQRGIPVDHEHPLFVYLPCGVGGAPGGIAFGLSQLFGDHVHPVFIEPTHSPAVLLGLMTGLKSGICVQDIGIDNRTEADGLAVGRASSFASTCSEQLISGIGTVEDEQLFPLLAMLKDSEGIKIEPSSAAGFAGPFIMAATNYAEKHDIKLEKATHIAWLTGGALVPEEEMAGFYARGLKKLKP
ncbi:D-serine ammonia-lyase [Planococcus sp. CP5-4]|uniref:D-serine ammonia-lyase n=1 Tax=unclassified Planococcus (in: firmicutes) TaxID=2662419 RepID=UPI001C233006|nr:MULTISPECIES: D-serine ammonia-lyase [unclassified Planococcus (in: firmicutes)]MBU9672128.1 D-serine ammonia-lyase [Planococcus sp. CP5-4_YE]MBV0907691.1 D-serine ammonia-lyase [Planococcus sp. CP5-4_UN]MBW6062858.1 D-serine ammonia-lyase [Planococcus sp. CP5-4]